MRVVCVRVVFEGANVVCGWWVGNVTILRNKPGPRGGGRPGQGVPALCAALAEQLARLVCRDEIHDAVADVPGEGART